MSTLQQTAAPAPPRAAATLVPVLAFAALTIAYVVVNRATPQPAATGAEVLDHFRTEGTGITWGSVLLLVSAVPLVLVAAAVHRRVRGLGGTAPVLVGGVLAAAALAFSALFAWTGGRLAEAADPALARALADLSFLAGGPAYALSFALLIGAISVTGLRAVPLPRALTWTGLALTVAGLVSTLTLADIGFGYLLPVVRFGGLVWFVFAAVLIARKPSRA